MARDNPVQFAVVREDPLLDAELLRGIGAPRVVLVCSGGCTALTLQSLFPDASFVLVDPNPAQLDLVRRKVDALARPAPERRSAFNVEDPDPAGLSQCGNFESLFRGLRSFLEEFVAPPDEWRRLLSPESPDRALLSPMTGSRWWPVAFEVFFHDAILNAMFGPDATQHAERGSYPSYFRRAFERGLAAPDAERNHFLHHVFLGRYVDGALPQHLAHPAPVHRFEYVEGTLDRAAPHLAEADVVHLSNVFDWMDERAVAATARAVAERSKPGAAVLWRQLNNTRDFRPFFGDTLRFEDDLGLTLLTRDRSLFYSSIHVGRRT